MSINIRYLTKKSLPGLLQARDMKLNEADTVQRVTRFFVEVLGYNPDTEISREMNKQGRHLDLAIKVDGSLQLIVEVKQAGVELQQKHLDQVLRYANEYKFWWAIITNGTRWKFYHFVASQSGIDPFLIFNVDLADTDALDQKVDMLSCLHRQEISQERLESVYQRQRASSPKVLGRALFTEEVLKALAREVRREEKVLLDVNELKKSLESMFSEELRDDFYRMRIKKKRARREPAEPISGILGMQEQQSTQESQFPANFSPVEAISRQFEQLGKSSL